MSMLYRKTEWEEGEHQRRDGKQAIQLQVCTLIHCDSTKGQSSHLRRPKENWSQGQEEYTQQLRDGNGPKWSKQTGRIPGEDGPVTEPFCEVASIHLVVRLSVTDTVFVHSDSAGEGNSCRQTDSNRKVGGSHHPLASLSSLFPNSCVLLHTQTCATHTFKSGSVFKFVPDVYWA